MVLRKIAQPAAGHACASPDAIALERGTPVGRGMRAPSLSSRASCDRRLRACAADVHRRAVAYRRANGLRQKPERNIRAPP
jgi:hypothetical protein